MIVNVPNFLTTVRLILGVYSGLLIFQEKYLFAGVVFLIAAITDCDGTIARWLNQCTKFGMYYDFIVDSIVIAIALVMLTIKGIIMLYEFGAIVLVACIYGSGLVMLLRHKPKEYSDMWSKVSGILLFVMILWFLFSFPYSSIIVWIVFAYYLFIACRKLWIYYR